jgi:acetylornithine deacetylase/succinyl-diaminopimelate desuccinylase-like protein
MAAQPLDEHVSKAILDAAETRGLRIVRMPSWAGHDAKILAPHFPAGLLFVPSIGGVSHAPEEETAPGHITGGAQVLLDTVRLLDARLNMQRRVR